MSEIAYKFRIYPTKKQEELIQKTFGCVRFIWNYYLALRKEIYEKEKKSLSTFDCYRHLTNLKKELPWLCEVDLNALRSEIQALDNAYKMFYIGLRNGKKVGFPKFKSKKIYKKSYTTKVGKKEIRLYDDSVHLAKLGNIKCKVSRKIKGRILNATIIQSRSGKYFVSIHCTDVEIEPLPKTGAVCGVDLGIKDLAITSDGVKYPNPRYLYDAEKKLAKLNRELARKSSGSKRREKARIKYAKQCEKVANQRRDYLQKLTTELIRNYDVICIEDLPTQNLMKNHCIAKSIIDASSVSFVGSWSTRQTGMERK